MKSAERLADPQQEASMEAVNLLKSIANPGRLRILCLLLAEDRSVGEIESALDASQSYVSGQLLRLRNDGLVNCERVGRSQRYHLADPRVRPILERVCEIFHP